MKKTKVVSKSKGILETTNLEALRVVESVVSPRQEVMTANGTIHDGTSKREASA